MPGGAGAFGRSIGTVLLAPSAVVGGNLMGIVVRAASSTGALAGGSLIGIVVRAASDTGALAGGSLMGIVVRAASSPALFSGILMRMVSRCLTPFCVGRVMRMVSFFISPMRTVSFFTAEPGEGTLMRMVSFFSPPAPGLVGRVMRTVDFLERLWSWAGGGVGSSAIVGSVCIALSVRGVNLWLCKNWNR